MKTLGVVQSRISSSRLPGKALMTLGGEPMALRVMRRLSAARGVDAVGLATSEEACDDVLADRARKAGFSISRGPVDDIVLRLRRAAEESGADILVRAWGDCAFLVADAAEAVLGLVAAGAPLASTNAPGAPKGWPAGFGIEAYALETLRALDDALGPGGPLREFPIEAALRRGLTPAHAAAPDHDLSVYLCVDYPEDLDAARRLAEEELAAGGPFLRSAKLFPFLSARRPITDAFSHAPRNVEYEAFKEAERGGTP